MASLFRNKEIMNAAAKARMRARPARSSEHSPVRIIVQGGVDVSDLGITVSSQEVKATRLARGFKKARKGKRRGKTNPYAI